MSEHTSEISYTPDHLILTVPWGKHIEAAKWLMGDAGHHHPQFGEYRVQNIEIHPFGLVQHMDGRIEYKQAQIIGEFAKWDTTALAPANAATIPAEPS